jgi:hypothetical protein
MKIPTYSAYYLPPRQELRPHIIYIHQPAGNLIGRLPRGSYPVTQAENSFRTSTLERTDGGDPFDYALFRTPAGDPLVIQRDEATEFPLRVVVGVDWENGSVTVLSNWADCPVELLNLSERNPELSVTADWQKAKEDLQEIDRLD